MFRDDREAMARKLDVLDREAETLRAENEAMREQLLAVRRGAQAVTFDVYRADLSAVDPGTRVALAHAAPLLALLACGTRTELPGDSDPAGDSGEPVSSSEAMELCAAACDHAWACAWDAPQDCDELCLDLSRDFRADAFRAVAGCLTGLACDANPDDCPDRAAASLDPLPSHERWSETCLERLPECDRADDSGACSPEFVLLYSDVLTDDLVACFEGACDELEACLKRDPLPL